MYQDSKGKRFDKNAWVEVPMEVTVPEHVAVTVVDGEQQTVIVPETRETQLFQKQVRDLSQQEFATLNLTAIPETPEQHVDERYFTRNEDGTVSPKPVEVVKQSLVAHAANHRWKKEVSGIEYSGISIATDDRSKIMILGARMAAESNPKWSTMWSTANGMVPIDAKTIVAISDVVQDHVNQCFMIYNTVLDAIASGSINTFEAVSDAFGNQE
jgi:virulence-associated protein VagC